MAEEQGGDVQPTSTVSLANNHFRADHDGSAIIMSISAGKFFSFDEIGFEIFDALEQPVRVDQLVADLAAKLGPGFALYDEAQEHHVTPWGSVQAFSYAAFRCV